LEEKMAELKNIFKFLKQYNDLTNPVITDLTNQIWSLDLSNISQIDEIKSKLDGKIENGEIFLEVTKPKLRPCPKPDDILLDWIDDNWNILSLDEVTFKDKITFQKEIDNEIIERIEYFEDDELRIESREKWISLRSKWRENEVPKEKGLQLYNKLFKLYSDIKKDSESVELILGDGIVNWYIDERDLNHPILLQKMKIEFNPQVPKFSIMEEENRTELYTAMLRVLSSVNQSMLTEIVKDIDSNDYQVHDFENTYNLYRRLINILDNNGDFVKQFVMRENFAQIYSKPVLFLRKRNLGYTNFLETIIDDIDNIDENHLPSFFNNLVGKHLETEKKIVFEEKWYKDGVDEDVLLTLPSNDEQLKIVKFLNEYNAVLVQGPPGTGKTHTIANLIGHLLSEGNSILVTSHTEKALKVLKEKVYKDERSEINLQNLCISLLTSRSQKKELDESINEISTKVSSLDITKSKKKIEKLKNKRKIFIKELEDLREKLLEIRSSEYKDIVYDNTTLTPVEASKFIRSGVGSIDYINGRTNDESMGFPLNDDELYFLYESNDKIEKDELLVLSSRIPDLDEIMSSEEFSKLVNKYKKIKKDLQKNTSIIRIKETLSDEKVREIFNLTSSFLDEINSYNDLQIFLFNKASNDGTYVSLWEDIFSEIKNLLNDFDELKKIKFKYDIELDNNEFNDENVELLKKIINTGKDNPLSGIGGLFKPKWKDIANRIKNNNSPIEKLDEFKATKKIIEYELNKRKLIKKINKLLNNSETSISFDDENFELKCANEIYKIKNPLYCYEEKWKNFLKVIKLSVKDDSNLDKEVDTDYKNTFISIKSNLNKIFSAFERRMSYIELKNIDIILLKYENKLREYLGENNLVDTLVEAFIKKDIETYKTKFEEFKEVLKKVGIYNKRDSIIKKISINSPTWAEEIRYKKGVHGKSEVPNKIKEAWKWRQLSNQIEKLDRNNINNIQSKIDRINKNILENSRALAYEKSWYEKVKNITQEQIQSIEGWRTTIRQIGMGTGKHAPKLKQKARELMPKSQSAVPVWIMTLNRVVENFNPKNNKFDVIIIDEASQSDILALAALYLGKKIIIVGDDEQVSPSSIGIKKDEISSLIELYLKDVPNNHLFNGETSLYDMAKSSGFKPLMLTEHFRCLPEIIEFSNSLSYNGRIKPLRDSSNVSVEPALVEYRVKNGFRDNKKVNKNEARHIASLICAAVEFEEYNDKTIGVISMSGNSQDYEIEHLLQRYLDPVEYESRNIQCGKPPQFQGDERDIIFISLVDGPNENGGPLRIVSEDGRNEMYRKRYNVAASRAKDQLWIVHSLNPEVDLKPDDIRLKLINHAKSPTLLADEINLDLAESPFEEEVMKLLMNKGFTVKPQVKVGAYRIDMVVEDGNNRVAIECDGERWHTIDDLPNDIKRQAILERLGWRFIRIRGSAYYRDPEKSMEEVYNVLEKNNIKPNFTKETNDDSNKHFLLDKLKRRANEIRNGWDDDLDIELELDKSNGEMTKEKESSKNNKKIQPTNQIKHEDTIRSEVNETPVSYKKEKTNHKHESKQKKVKKTFNKNKIKNSKNNSENKGPAKPIFDFRKKKK
jgi:very-short-patch-repair endonuclease